VQLIEVGVLVDHSLDELDQVVVVGQSGLHVGVGSLFLEISAQLFGVTRKSQNVITHKVNHFRFFLKLVEGLGIPNFGLNADQVVEVVQLLERHDFKLHLGQFGERLLWDAQEALCVVELLAAAIEQLLLGFETGQAVGGFLGT